MNIIDLALLSLLVVVFAIQALVVKWLDRARPCESVYKKLSVKGTRGLLLKTIFSQDISILSDKEARMVSVYQRRYVINVIALPAMLLVWSGVAWLCLF